MPRGNSFSRDVQPFRCEGCGRNTTGKRGSNCILCPKCYHAEGLRNEHSDSGHEQPVRGCPDCPAQPQQQQEQEQNRSWEALHESVMSAALAQGLDADYAAAYLQRNQERILPRLMGEETADPAAQAEARGATRIARPGPNGWRMIYRGNTVLGRCQLVESATPGCSGTGGRDTYYYVESGCGPYSPRRENTTTLADVRALFESPLRSAKLSQTAALAALPGAAAAHRAAFAARRQDPNSADLLRASEEAATRLQQVINAAVASTPSGGRGHRAAAVAGRTFGLTSTRSQAGRRGNRKTETWWQVYETTPGTAPERVAESLGSLDAAHREIAKRCGLLAAQESV